MATAREVAEWMRHELDRENYLYQEVVVTEIESKFGPDFVYINELGNMAISRKVLAEFRKLTGDEVVWERGERLWRKRERHDEAGRSQY